MSLDPELEDLVEQLGSSPEEKAEPTTEGLATLGEILETHHRRFVRKVREAREREEGA